MKNLLIPFVIIALFALYLNMIASDSEEKASYRFSHKLHVVEQEMECSECHDQVENSMSGKDDLMPGRTLCLDCHEEAEISAIQWEPIISYSVKFSHQRHLESVEDCQSCHGALLEEEVVVVEHALPTMINCLDCHQSQFVSIKCSTCHLPEDNLLPASHTQNFIHNHSDLARNQMKVMSANMECTVCHKQQFCQECHEGDNLDRFSHPLNYEVTHALDAQTKERECTVCHTERQFCIECHRDNNILPHNHTAGWTNTFPGDGGRHRVEALNDIEACIACHEQNAEQTCQPCHGQ